MQRWLLCLGAVLCVALPAQAATVYAVLVGASKYSPPMRSTTHAGYSVRYMGDALKWVYGPSQSRGGNTRAVISYVVDEDIGEPQRLEPTPRNIKNEMKRVFSQAGEDDMILFYFTGHGLYLPGRGHSLLGMGSAGADTPGDNLELDDVLKAVKENTKVRRKLVLIDACRSIETDANNPEPSSNDFYAGSAFALSVWGDAVVYTAAQTSEEAHLVVPNQPIGYFTQALVWGLVGRADGINGSGRDGVVTLSELETYVHDIVYNRVREEADGTQHPRLTYESSRGAMELASLARTKEEEPSGTLSEALGYSWFGLTVGHLLDAQKPDDWFKGLMAYRRTDADSLAAVRSEVEHLLLRRIYDSREADRVGPFGRGWFSALDARLDMANSTPTRLEFVSSMGSRYQFTSPEHWRTVAKRVATKCSWLSLDEKALQTMPLSSLLRTNRELACLQPTLYHSNEIPGAELSVTASDLRISLGGKTEYLFNRTGRLAKILDRAKNYEFSLAYKSGLPLEATMDESIDSDEQPYSSQGHYTFVYKDGLVTRLQTDHGALNFEYDTRQRLTKVRLDDTLLYQYGYDDSNRLVTTTNRLGLVPLSAAVEYDAVGARVGLVSHQFRLRWSRPQAGRIELVAQDTGLGTLSTLQADWEGPQLILRDVQKERTRRYKLLPCCSLVPQTVALDTKTQPRLTKYRYNANQGVLTSVQFPKDQVEVNWNAPFGRVESFEHRQGTKRLLRYSYEYDDRNRMSRVRSHDGESIELGYGPQGGIAELRKSRVQHIPGTAETKVRTKVMNFQYTADGALAQVLVDGKVALPPAKTDEADAPALDGDLEDLLHAVRYRGAIDEHLVPMWLYLDTDFRRMEGTAFWDPDARHLYGIQTYVLQELE
jgi:YD repeat-containing protein